MKNKFWTLFLLALLLTGCRKAEAEPVTQGIPETEVPVTAAQTEPAETALFDVVLEDRSLRNENGDVLVQSVYEKLILQGPTPQTDAINEAIQADCDRFFEQSGATTYYEPEILEQMIQDMGMSYGDLLHNAYANVTHNQDRVLSVCVTTDWYMGGVFNEDYYGMTFDLATGERVGLEQLSAMPAAELEIQLKRIVADWAREAYGEGLFCEPEAILADYSLEELLFYVQDGELVLTFPTYTFTAGAAGAAVIPTGLMISDIAK